MSESGVITVYLALILLLILSLTCTIIEGARISTAKVYAERALSTAMDSIWAEYYGPLWEEYHIFGYVSGEGSDRDKANQMEEKLTRYMSYTFEPNTDLDTNKYSAGMELYDISTSSVSVKEQTRLMDYEGELMINEAVEYMKYQELGDGLTLLLDKLSLLDTPKKVSAVYEDKLAAEEELAKADQNILRLMELLDGIRTSRNGIKLDKNGKLQTKEYFVKKLCHEPITMESVGINHKVVFEAVKNNYVNPSDPFIQIRNEINEMKLIMERLNTMKEEINSTMSSLEIKKEQLQAANSSTDSQGSKQQIKSLKEEINSMGEQLNDLYSAVQEQQEKKQQLTNIVEEELTRIKKLIGELIPIVEEAEQESEAVVSNATNASYLIEDFEESLDEYRDIMSEEVMEGLEDSLKEMMRYSTSYEEEAGYYEMCEDLRYKLLILVDCQAAIQSALEGLQKEDYSAVLYYSEESFQELLSYDIKSIQLDYSSLTFDQSKQLNPIEEIGKLMESGITGLVIDPDSISDKKLTGVQMPSVEAALQRNIEDFGAMISAFFTDTLQGGEENEMGSLFFNFGATTELATGMEDGINRIAEHLLYQEYLKEHFKEYPTEKSDLSGRKPSVLAYEQEYILVGRDSDRENLSSVVSRIVFMRMMLNFVTLLGDRARCEEAKLAATAIVGFTGLPMLISITQAVLLLIWSFAEGLVDTCALLMGNKVPILKQTLRLQFPEIFMLNRNFIKSKAAGYIDTKQLSLSYQDYLRLFLLIKDKKELAFRSMDLIQENLNLRYEEKFYLRNCLFGVEVEAEYITDSKFIAIPFVKKAIDSNHAAFGFSSKAVYSY